MRSDDDEALDAIEEVEGRDSLRSGIDAEGMSIPSVVAVVVVMLVVLVRGTISNFSLGVNSTW